MIRTYSELSKLKTLDERFQYLRLDGKIGEVLFGYARYLNQTFYSGSKWKKVRREVIIRDKGNDLGVEGYQIPGFIYVHHMNPLTIEQLKNNDPMLWDPENLISVSSKMHEAITWGDESLLPKEPIIRKPNDTVPWKYEEEGEWLKAY